MFANRTEELAALRRWWDKDQRPALVWGRRRVGKTALLQRFSLEVPTIFHTGAGRPAADEVRKLSGQAAGILPNQLRDLTARPYVDWDDALDGLALAATDQPLLLILDEFPELVSGFPELPGVLRAFLDRTTGRTRLRLLLCGSAVRYMSALQEHRAPLYGRFDLSLQIHPFSPHETSILLPSLKPSEQALVYGLVGGMPLYLSWWNSSTDLSENVLRLVCWPGAPLLNEGQLILATEVEQGEYPAAVLHAIASGKTRYGEIKDILRAEPARTLDRLIQLRLVERLVPVTEETRSRRVIYRISDNFLAFYLHVISQFRTEIERGLGKSILPVLVKSLDDFMGPRWEEMFRAHLRRLIIRGDLGNDIVSVGPWWSERSDHEIDAVVLAGRAREAVLAGEAKWSTQIEAPRVLSGLRAKAARLPKSDPQRLRYALCSREHVTHVPEDIIVVTAADIFAT